MCDTLAIVAPGCVLFAKNSDRDPNEAQHLDWQPRRSHPAGASVRCTWIEIPQARETHAVLLSRPYWMFGAEIGANEHGVTIGNEAVFTRQPNQALGLTGMDLIRLALERAASAVDAVRAMVELLERHGQGGGCGHENRRFTYHNSFIIADPQCAFVLETAGREHAVESIRGARSISNGLSIPDFAARHSDAIKTRVSGCRLRAAITQRGASVASSPRDLMRILRDHGNATDDDIPIEYRSPRYSLVNGGLGAPCCHAGGLVAASQTTASWVAELTPHGCRHWVTASAAPCTGLFKPVAVEAPLELGAPPTDRADGHSLWWRHERLHRAALRNYVALAPRFLPERDEVERRWLADPPSSAEAFAEGDRLLAKWTHDMERHVTADHRPWFVRRYWGRRDAWAGLV
jgi:GrpB-like predicted nucleotidyltransferase (UPF0157 family)